MNLDLLIVGNPEPFHVGAHLANAAASLSVRAEVLDLREAFRCSRLSAKWHWWFRDRLPARFEAFGNQVLDAVRRSKPACVVTTGMAPVSAAVLSQLGRLGVRRVNYLTDDPWNPAVRCNWFLEALGHYDDIYSPRLSNLEELRREGARVHYLPFGYAPEIHFRPAENHQSDSPALGGPEVLFVGGADRDRLPWIEELLKADFEVALYGGRWERYPSTRPCFRGMAGPQELRHVTRNALVTLCLVRRANRDGHVMRSLEIPALGGCMLAEWTEEHEALLGRDGECVRFFDTPSDMVAKVRWLLANPAERRRLSENAWRRITEGENTYAARLRRMLQPCA